MKKTLIITGIVLFIFLLVALYFRFYVKAFSPEADVVYEKDGLNIHIKYCRPYKKGREIFGKLVPFGQVWRTGANEATIFETATDLRFNSDKTLKAGAYSLFTIPGEKTWKIIFNSESGQWGINFNGIANREPKNDVLDVESPVVADDKSVEQFTIDISKVGDETEMTLKWDKTIVPVSFSK